MLNYDIMSAIFNKIYVFPLLFVVVWPTKTFFVCTRVNSLQESFRKRSKRLTSACSSISWVSCLTPACVRSNSIITHRIDATAMSVSRTLVDIWEKCSEAWRKDKKFCISLMVVQHNFDQQLNSCCIHLPYSYPLPPKPCIILHIIQKQNQTILYSYWRYFKALNHASLHVQFRLHNICLFLENLRAFLVQPENIYLQEQLSSVEWYVCCFCFAVRQKFVFFFSSPFSPALPSRVHTNPNLFLKPPTFFEHYNCFFYTNRPFLYTKPMNPLTEATSFLIRAPDRFKPSSIRIR